MVGRPACGCVAPQEAKTKNRRVEFFPGEDGMATLWVYDTAERLRGLYNLPDHAARQAKAASVLAGVSNEPGWLHGCGQG